MNKVQPILVPCRVGNGRQNVMQAPRPAYLPYPLSVCLTHAAGKTKASRGVRMTFHRGGSLGADPVHLDFEDSDRLNMKYEWTPVDGVKDRFVDRARSLYWDRFVLPEPLDYWQSAAVACGFSERGKVQQWDWHRLHVHDHLVIHSRSTTCAEGSPFLRADQLQGKSLAAQVSEAFSPEQHVLLVAWMVDEAPSNHKRLSLLSTVSAWLTWLAGSYGWEAFAEPVSLVPVHH